MLVSMRKFFTEKAQGLTEYVLILAFVGALAFMMFGTEDSMKSAVVSTFNGAKTDIQTAGQNAGAGGSQS